MTKYFFTITLLTIFYSCSENKEQTIIPEIIVKKIERDYGLTDFYMRKNESDTAGYWKTVKGDVEVFSELTEKGLTIKTVNKNHQRIVNLGKLKDAYQLPKVEWISDEIVCVHTFTEEATANIFFIPYNTNKSISFFNHEMVGIAPENNVIVYIKEISNPYITYAIYNVKNKKEVTIETQLIHQKAEHPYFEKLIFNNKKAMFTMGSNKEYVLNYSEIIE